MADPEYKLDPDPTPEELESLGRFIAASPVAYSLGEQGIWAGFRPIDGGASVVRLLFAVNPRFKVVSFQLRNGQVVRVRRKP